jgi:hypothetical protein
MKELNPENISVKAFKEGIEAKGNGAETYVVSKWHASEIVKSFEKLKKSDRNNCIKEILGYASSSTEISSIFIKVS